MSHSNAVYNNLRQKLDVLGYTQTLPLAAIPLVGTLFEDLVKTTESLRDAKKQIGNLLEEKSCWELGVEPYKCDNSRLLVECNDLHLRLLKRKEEFENCAKEFNERIRQLQNDKLRLEQHCQKLEQQVQCLLSKQSSAVLGGKTLGGSRTMKQKELSKKPFISTVRSGEQIPKTPLATNLRCSKCNSDTKGAGGDGKTFGGTHNLQVELSKLEERINDLTQQIEFHKRKIEARDREIRRLNELLSGGRSAVALAKECCYKDVDKLSEDVVQLQREKSEILTKMQSYEDKMHEAMKRAMNLETQNNNLLKELDELKETALSVETQANKEVAEREQEIRELKKRLQGLEEKRQINGSDSDMASAIEAKLQASMHKLYVEECEKASNLRKENEMQIKKIIKLHHKIHHLQKELKDKGSRNDLYLDEEKIRIRSERDFFQKEYLRLMNKTGSDKEIAFLQEQIKSKDEELRLLRSELCSRQEPLPPPPIHTSATATANVATTTTPSLPVSARSTSPTSHSSDCVQALVLRVERERDCVRAELERVRCERDALREKHLSLTQLNAAKTEQQQQQLQIANDQLQASKECVRQLECEVRELKLARIPCEKQIALLKEEIVELKGRLTELQAENCKLRSTQNQLKGLQEQTHASLLDYQNRLLIADNNLDAAENRLKALDTSRESTRQETASLRNEVAALRKTYVNLENEKDKILAQLDAKTERAYQLEYEFKACKEKRYNLEQQVKELEERLQKLQTRARERDTAFNETSAESKTLRQQIAALKASRDQAIVENGRLSNDLAESQAEILILKRKLKDSEQEIERLKQQLQQYVQEVKKAEDLLMDKEKEREEMLEHYRSLSHDAVLLEGNNQSLEVEAAEYKQKCSELELEIEKLKKDLSSRNGIIKQLEDKLSTLDSQSKSLKRQLEEASDIQRLLKVDLQARKELCDKLDIEKDRLHAELNEMIAAKRKLEDINDKLRIDLEQFTMDKKVSADTLEELLTKTRRDLEEQIRVDSKLGQELVRLRKTNEELLTQLDKEKERRKQQESLTYEYQVQNQELRHNITDDRFRQARSREQSPLTQSATY